MQESEVKRIKGYLNFYKCPKCNNDWIDTWDCTVDDTCPCCGARDISPSESVDVSDTVKVKE